MKKNMLFVFAIIFLFAIGIAYAGQFRGLVTAMKDDKSSIAVISNDDKKEYRFDCDKGVIHHDVKIGKPVIVYFEKEGNTKKPTKIIPDIGC